jgi:hypothetical protein
MWVYCQLEIAKWLFHINTPVSTYLMLYIFPMSVSNCCESRGSHYKYITNEGLRILQIAITLLQPTLSEFDGYFIDLQLLYHPWLPISIALRASSNTLQHGNFRVYNPLCTKRWYRGSSLVIWYVHFLKPKSFNSSFAAHLQRAKNRRPLSHGEA